MKKLLWVLWVFVFSFLLLACVQNTSPIQGNISKNVPVQFQKLSPRTYIHISYLDIGTPEKVPCNGMIVVNEGQAVIFDTPPDDAASRHLIAWVEDSLSAHVKAIIPTHFHQDCLGGLRAFHEKGIPSYALQRTRVFADSNRAVVPQRGFEEHLEIQIGGEQVIARFHGEGHTRDNIVGYFPAEEILFGGCMIKSLGAGEGNLADANVKAWAASVANIKAAYPDLRVVIPGHGDAGSAELFDYTIDMFASK